ncbi:MAG: hypothetical protein KC621_14095 [Myxococcales bacterium]|nr:hypothetical protein [Myxococcales bacterium]
MPITFDDPVVRDADALLDAVDSTVGWVTTEPHGLPVSLLSALRWRMCGDIHLFSQGWMTGFPDGPELLGALASEVRPLDPAFADLVLWVASRGARHRDRDENEPFASVVNLVGRTFRPAADVVTEALAARWPDGRVLEAGPTPRYTPAGLGERPRVSLDPALGPEQARTVVAGALFRAGATDEELESCFAEMWEAGTELPEVLARWVLLEGAPSLDELRAALFPPHPLALLLGHEVEPWGAVHVFPADRWEELVAALEPWSFVRCEASPEVTLGLRIRGALRMDAEGLVVRGETLSSEDRALLEVAAQTGHAVVICGEGAPT